MLPLLCAIIALLLYSPALQAQEKAPSVAVEVPAEYKAFFDDYSALIKEYPAVARRFGLFDRSPDSTPIIRSAFCAGPNQCCVKYIDEGSLRCVECSFCPK